MNQTSNVYGPTTAARLRTGVVLAILALIFLYSSRKALGLWSGSGAKLTDPQLFNLNLNTTVPAFLLTLVALGCLGVAWYLVVELLTSIRINESGLGVAAPGYRLFYRWDEIASVAVQETSEDGPTRLEIKLVASPSDEMKTQDEVTRRPMTALVRRSRATRPDGRPLPLALRLLYPQAARPDVLLLYPALDDRPALLAAIEQRFGR